MKILSQLLLFSLVTGASNIAFTEVVSPGQQVPKEFVIRDKEGNESTIRYLLFLPKSYTDNKNCPLMLFLHGAGERGDDLSLVAKWGPPKLVKKGDPFPFVLISPQCAIGKFWNVDELAALVAHTSDSFKIDRARMYVTGLSMGGYGTWKLAAKYPDMFAAAIPICGGGDTSSAELLKKLPIWAFHGEDDRVVGLSESKNMVEAIQRVGGKAKLTVYPSVGHNSWTQTYANPKVYDWLLSQHRGDEARSTQANSPDR